MPDPIETLIAAEELVKLGFVVLPYIHADPDLCKRLEEVGTIIVDEFLSIKNPLVFSLESPFFRLYKQSLCKRIYQIELSISGNLSTIILGQDMNGQEKKDSWPILRDVAF